MTLERLSSAIIGFERPNLAVSRLIHHAENVSDADMLAPHANHVSTPLSGV
jgi:hypothetical protein